MKILSGAFLALLLAAPRASAYNGGEVGSPMQSDTSIGPRYSFYHPDDADHGDWAPGFQLDLHMTPNYAFQASMDFANYTSGGTSVRSTPIQATVLGFFSPDASFSPYLLVGGGWYPTHANGPYNPQRLFGPHVGAGLELLISPSWSIDGSYRFLWTEIITWSRPLQILGTDFSVRGNMFTVALNYRL
ncbi:MAG TPA: outer membrane beta-barrel protein [Elusimicrobiota bacterium]|jgi:opacity protein-like surface antigen|nr:outer membrane beta-barrel protein [Elusimicrobiota bacterium]